MLEMAGAETVAQQLRDLSALRPHRGALRLRGAGSSPGWQVGHQ